MKYFKRLKTGVDVRSLLEEIASHPDPWAINAGRQDKIKVQREAQSILPSAGSSASLLP